MRGFLAGGFWGLVIGGVAVGGASLVNPPPSSATADLPPENELRVGDETAVAAPSAPEITAPIENAPVIETPAAEAPVQAEAAPETVEVPIADAAPTVEETDAAPVITGTTDAGAEPASASADQEETGDAPEEPVVTSDGSGTEENTATDASPATTSDEPEAVEVESETSSAPAAIQSDFMELVTPPAETTAPDVPNAQAAADPDTAAAPAMVLADPANPAPDVSADTAPSNAPVVANAGSLDAPDTPAASTAPVSSSDGPVTSAVQSEAPAAPARDQVDEVSSGPLTEPTVVSDAPEASDKLPSDAPAPEVVAATDTAPLTPQEPISPATPAQGDEVPVADTSSADQETAEVVEVVDEPIVSVLPSGDTGVRVNRLALSSDAAEEAVAEDAATEAEALDPDAPAVKRFAAPYSNPEGLPEMSVVLTDDGSFDGAVAAVAGIPFPVSVMLNPTAEGALDRMRAYRAAGIEVGMLINLPPAATASDVAIYFEAALGSLPEAFAVLDAQGATQGDADVIWQTVSALSEDGLGLITVPRGLNSAPRVAAENGVAAGVVFRDIDAEGQDARVISRFMDQAAFRARQNSGVIMLGQVRTETISGLTRWGAANRADTVAVVPVSATLTAE